MFTSVFSNARYLIIIFYFLVAKQIINDVFYIAKEKDCTVNNKLCF